MSKKQCNEEMLVFSRVVGYYSPLTQWNKGKVEEFKLRKTFNINALDLNDEEEAEINHELSALTI